MKVIAGLAAIAGVFVSMTISTYMSYIVWDALHLNMWKWGFLTGLTWFAMIVMQAVATLFKDK